MKDKRKSASMSQIKKIVKRKMSDFGKMRFRAGKLRRKDYKKALEFTMEGMQVDQYSDSRIFQYIYGIYFLFMEMDHATRMIAVYEHDELAGLIMADLHGEKKRYRSFGRWLYMQLAELIMGLLTGGGTNVYGEANASMLQEYCKAASPDGEINYLAVDQKLRGQGIGSKLVLALKKKAPGKELYLYTDSNCIYQFYDRKGFTREQTREIQMEIQGKEIPLTCMLYSIRF